MKQYIIFSTIVMLLCALHSNAQQRISVSVNVPPALEHGMRIKLNSDSLERELARINASVVLLKDTSSAQMNQKNNWKRIGLTDSLGFFLKTLSKKEQKYSFIVIENYGWASTPQRIETDDTMKISLSSRKILVAKPAIYLYPTQKTTVHIQHDFKGEIGTTYPAYRNGWKVIAEPDGALLNLADNRKYEYLFWDGIYTFPATHFDYKEGFVVAKENTTDFLWKQLAHIGLNEKEINDFVVYWLPQLERNEHNFIYFHINNDIDHSSILTVQPQPDSWIRLFMEFKSVPANYTIAQQQLPTIKRNGFTLVEWGGAVIENSSTNFE